MYECMYFCRDVAFNFFILFIVIAIISMICMFIYETFDCVKAFNNKWGKWYAWPYIIISSITMISMLGFGLVGVSLGYITAICETIKNLV